MKNMFKGILVGLAAMALAACGERVEVPPASVGLIMTPSGYEENLIPTSKFRLDPCWAYCDRLVTVDVSDKTYNEPLSIFIPEDKLNIGVQIKTTLSIDPRKTKELFNSLSPRIVDDFNSTISSGTIYETYAKQIVQAEVREYLSQYSISQIASSNEKVNADLRERLTERLSKRTPFVVRYAGITDIKYPAIITEAQEKSAERREAIQQEEAQLQISKVRLERELQEARLNRAIEMEKAETEAEAQRTLAESVDPRVLQLRALDNQRAWIETWDGKMPATMLGDAAQTMMMVK